jgi:hypothetical protein
MPCAPSTADAAEVESEEAEALAPTEIHDSTLLFIDLSKGAGADGPPIGLFLSLLLGAALIFSASLCGAVFRRRIRKIPTLNDDWVMRLSDDGVSSSSKRGEGRLDWSGFSKARRLADGLLLFQGPNSFHWFPDGACTQPALPSDVDDLVRRHVSDYRDVGRRASSDGTQTARAGEGQRSRLMTA